MSQLILQPGPTEGEDTYIASGYSLGSNFGDAVIIRIGKLEERGSYYNVRGLIRFDLSSIPVEATILTAILTLSNDGSESDALTVYCYRCTKPWTELGATYILYDGSSQWDGSEFGGNWDSSIVASDSIEAGEDIELDVAELVSDAVKNRSGELSLLLKTNEPAALEYIDCYSSDEAVETLKRPKLVVEYLQTGSRIYLGDGGVENIDWDAPVAFVPQDTNPMDISVSLEPNRRYTLAARRVSAAGVEEHNTHVVTILETDADGALQSAPLPRPFDLSFERVRADTIRLGFSCDVPLGYSEPTEYRVYGDGGTGEIDFDTPVAILTEHVAGRREFVIELPVTFLPMPLACQAWRDGRSGPASSVLVIPKVSLPIAPAIISDI